MYSCGPLRMVEQKQGRPARTYIQPLQDVALKTCRKQWTIEKGGEKESGRSVLMERHNDNELIHLFIHWFRDQRINVL